MGYALIEIELSRPVKAIRLAPGKTGLGLIARWRDRLIGFLLIDLDRRSGLSADELAGLTDEAFAMLVLTERIKAELSAPPAVALPSLTVAVCTKDRAARLARLLASLQDARQYSPFTEIVILVVDNASVDGATREVAEAAEVRYIFEPKAGLNFARNAAVANASGTLLAFLDDDVVVDRYFFEGLATAWRSAPDAGGFTGLVLPFRLDTEAQVCFEQRGGFGRGFQRREFRATSSVYPLHPVGAGLLGAGCNMAFDRALLQQIGGFDEALDTGQPLPGGGDLDIFYRVLRAGHTMVYEPRYAVYHEHRETIAQLRRQYWTWGLGMMAFLAKSWRADVAYRAHHRELVRWWILDQIKSVMAAAMRLQLRELRFRAVELAGGVKGLLGEYDRSQRRVSAIRDRQP